MNNVDLYIENLSKYGELHQLRPITDRVRLLKDHLDGKYWYNPDFLTIDNVLPIEKRKPISSDVVKRFRDDLSRIDCLPEKSKIDTLYYLIEKYFSRLASDEFDDVSVFDRNRVDAAIAWAKNFIYEDDSNSPFILIKGDVSGIQNFIYHIPDSISGQTGEGKKKAKRLRGRSFYISILTDTIADVLIRDLNLQEANILYAGGGHFTLLAPNTPETKKILEDSEKTINKFFLDNFQLRLSIVIRSIDVSINVIEDYKTAYQKLEEKIAKAKKQKVFTELDKFTDCIKTGNEDIDLLFEDIGGQLTKTTYLIEVYSEDSLRLQNGVVVIFQGLGITWLLVKDLTEILREGCKRIRVFSLNNTVSFLESLESSISDGSRDIAFGFKFIGNYVPVGKDSSEILCKKMKTTDPLDFEELAKLDLDDENKGLLNYPLLSVLRLDVDNLGAIFSFGLESKGKTSLYQMSALSRDFIYFFCFYMNKLASKYRCYITYSGGDDAFIVGSWINILRFSQKLHTDFHLFGCNNPNLTFSAGIVHCNSHYPIQKAAQLAGNAEEKAKEYNKNEKDAVSVFARIVRWTDLTELIDFSDTIVQAVESKNDKEKISRSVIFRILVGIYNSINETEKIKLRYMLKYWFARSPHNITSKKLQDYREGQHDQTENLKIKIAQKLIEGSLQPLFENYAIVMNYVLLKTRKSKG